MIIKAENMYEAWVKVNEDFMVMDTKSGMYMPSRDYTRVLWPVRLHVSNGFGFDGYKDHKKLPPFYAKYENRIKLLAKRYIDVNLWMEATKRLKFKEKKMSAKNPLSFTYLFHRKETRERKVPAGGGCLNHVTLVWFDGRWSLHVNLRASEITAALIGDIAFIEWIVKQIREEVRLKNWSDDELEVVWDISLASQMKSIIPLFLQYTGGDHRVLESMYRDPKNENEWFADVIRHFWHVFIHLERVTWHRRQRWTKQFLNTTKVDWSRAFKRWSKDFYEDISEF